MCVLGLGIHTLQHSVLGHDDGVFQVNDLSIMLAAARTGDALLHLGVAFTRTLVAGKHSREHGPALPRPSPLIRSVAGLQVNGAAVTVRRAGGRSWAARRAIMQFGEHKVSHRRSTPPFRMAIIRISLPISILSASAHGSEWRPAAFPGIEADWRRGLRRSWPTARTCPDKGISFVGTRSED
jgi:hypothetical protein